MRLIYEDLETVLEWRSDEVPIIVIENLTYKNKFIKDFFQQSNTTNDAPFFISDGSVKNNRINFEVILNPFDIEVNKAAIVNATKKVYENLIIEDVYELSKLTGEVNTYLNRVANSLPVNVELEGNLNIKRLLQLFELSIVSESSTLLESIIDYLQVCTQLGLNNLYVFMNLKQFLNKDELKELYKFIMYEEINLILIENHMTDVIEKEKHFIIDHDLCVIY